MFCIFSVLQQLRWVDKVGGTWNNNFPTNGSKFLREEIMDAQIKKIIIFDKKNIFWTIFCQSKDFWWEGGWEILLGHDLVWLMRAVVCLLAANRRSNLFADGGIGWPHSALRYH